MDPSAQLIELLNPRAGERILDLGCGIGELAARIAGAGAAVTGIDPLGVLLEQARYKYPQIEFMESGLFEFAPAEPFDGVFAHAVLDWISPPERALERIRELLKPVGRMAAAIGGANETARNLDSYYAPSPKEYSKLLKKRRFEVEVCEMRGADLVVLARRPV